jgi:mannose-1-phosphate guanylyltransferase
MLQHTLDRTKLLIPQRRIVTVVNHAHQQYVRTQLGDQPPETILVQPCSRETANGILLALLHVQTQDPNAIVCVFPSDHFVLEESKFMEYVDRAIHFARTHRDSMVLLGVQPSHAEEEYGWIEKSDAVANPGDVKIHRVGQFWEKPNPPIADALLHHGCLWNTMILVGTASSILSQYMALVPETVEVLHEVVRNPDPVDRDTLLNLTYPDLPPLNFSKDILEHSTSRLCVMEVSDVCWSDWGNESRVLQDAERLHLKLFAQRPSVYA